MTTQCYTVTPHPIEKSEINIAIGDKAPSVYFRELLNQCNGGKKRYGGIINLHELKANLSENCIPESSLSPDGPDYDTFLEERRTLMAAKMKIYFQTFMIEVKNGPIG